MTRVPAAGAEFETEDCATCLLGSSFVLRPHSSRPQFVCIAKVALGKAADLASGLLLQDHETCSHNNRRNDRREKQAPWGNAALAELVGENSLSYRIWRVGYHR